MRQAYIATHSATKLSDAASSVTVESKVQEEDLRVGCVSLYTSATPSWSCVARLLCAARPASPRVSMPVATIYSIHRQEIYRVPSDSVTDTATKETDHSAQS